MKNTWLGYLSTVLMVLAGVLMFFGEKPIIGSIFIVIAITGLVLRISINKKNPEN
jgi:hypothetical protein